MFGPPARARYLFFKAHTLKMKLLILGLSKITFYEAILKTEQQ